MLRPAVTSTSRGIRYTLDILPTSQFYVKCLKCPCIVPNNNSQVSRTSVPSHFVAQQCWQQLLSNRQQATGNFLHHEIPTFSLRLGSQPPLRLGIPVRTYSSHFDLTALPEQQIIQYHRQGIRVIRRRASVVSPTINNHGQAEKVSQQSIQRRIRIHFRSTDSISQSFAQVGQP